MRTQQLSFYYLVRAMDQMEDHYALFFERECVAVGWSAVDFSAGEPEDVVARVVERYYANTDAHPTYVGIRKNEVRRFLHMQPGDRVVVPVSRGIRLAEVNDGLEYDVAAAVPHLDLANQRPVRYLRAADGELLTVPRAELSEGLLRRLRVRGAAVRDLSEFAPELDHLFRSRRSADHAAAEQSRLENTLKHHLLDALRNGRTLLAAGGQGLEHLVAELLEIDGYTAEVLSKRAFEGTADADIKATRQDHVKETQLLVQGKHHGGQSGTWGAEQLAEIRRQQDERWADHDLVLLTTAAASRELTEEARRHQITVLDGEALVTWIVDAHHALRPSTKRALGISDIPAHYSPVPA